MPTHLGLITSSYYYLIMIACGSDGKESACSAEHSGLILGLGRSTGEGNGYPLPVFLPGEFRGQSSLSGYSLCGNKESDMTEQLITIITYLVVTTSSEPFREEPKGGSLTSLLGVPGGTVV